MEDFRLKSLFCFPFCLPSYPFEKKFNFMNKRKVKDLTVRLSVCIVLWILQSGLNLWNTISGSLSFAFKRQNHGKHHPFGKKDILINLSYSRRAHKRDVHEFPTHICINTRAAKIEMKNLRFRSTKLLI